MRLYKHRSIVSFNPFFSGDVVGLFDFFDLSSGSINFSSVHKLDFDVFLDDSSFGSEKDDGLSFSDVLSLVKESFDSSSFVSQNDSSSLSNLLNANNLK